MNTDANRKFILISLLVIIIFGIMLFGIRLMPALAEEWTNNFDELIKTAQPRLINDQATQEADQSGTENAPDHQDSTSNTSSPDPAVSLQTMVQDFETNTFSQAGWLHYVYYQESEVPNGVTLPQNYTVDGWYLVDEAGYVSQEVGSYYDDTGNLILRGIFIDNTFINLNTKEEIKTEGPYKLKLDLGLITSMLEMQMKGSILTQEFITLSEKPMVKFSLTGNYDNPANFSNSSQPVKSVRVTALFDQTTGAISEYESVFILLDGTEELFSRVQISTLEWGNLPQEFIQLLEGK